MTASIFGGIGRTQRTTEDIFLISMGFMIDLIDENLWNYHTTLERAIQFLWVKSKPELNTDALSLIPPKGKIELLRKLTVSENFNVLGAPLTSEFVITVLAGNYSQEGSTFAVSTTTNAPCPMKSSLKQTVAESAFIVTILPDNPESGPPLIRTAFPIERNPAAHMMQPVLTADKISPSCRSNCAWSETFKTFAA